MTAPTRRIWIILPALALWGLVATVFAAETPTSASNNMTISVASEPARYSFVNGDASKFRALHWIDDGFVMGVKDFSLTSEMQDGVTLESEGHAVPGEGDYEGLLILKKEDLGYIKFDYDQFRKYYANGAGFYGTFPTLAQNYTDKELALNIGKFGVEAGITMKNIPDITLLYEREFKQGTKSRLTWARVTDFVNGANRTRGIGPSWQEIDERVDSFDVKLADTVNGFNWKSDQHWEFVRANNMREEQSLSAGTVTVVPDTNQKIRDQFTEPRSELFTSTLGVDKWLSKDRFFVSSGYRFAQLTNHELENIFEMDSDRNPRTFSNAEQVRDAHSDNLYTSQTWVGSAVTTIFAPLTLITKMKAETIHRDSSSTYPKDKSPGSDAVPGTPNGIIDEFSVSENQEKLTRLGETFAIRYTGFSHVALYNEYEFEQDRSNLYEDRQSVTAGEQFNREDITHMRRGVGTLGGQYVPWNHFTTTMNVRHRLDDISYDHVRYTNNSASGAKSVFIDGQTLETDEVETKATWKPSRWFQPSFRYQLQDRTYKTWGLPNSDIRVATALISNIYTWDIFSQVTDDLMMTASFSFQDGKIITPARYAVPAPAIPTFDFDVYTSLFSIEYALNKDVVLTGTGDYTRAANFKDFSELSTPYGADFHQADVTVGVRWTAKKDLTIEPKYAWYQYTANEAEVGSYNAHVIWLDVKCLWG